MKKLSLKKLNLGASDLLQRNELKSVVGGGYGGPNGNGGNVDCFAQAIQDLNDFEADIGHSLSQSLATEYLNDSYAVCFCMNNITDPLQYDACYGT